MSRKTLMLIIKTVIVIVIPYIISIHSSSSETSITVTGILGIWTTADTTGMTPELHYQIIQNDLFFSLLAILPLLFYSHFIGEGLNNKKNIFFAGLSVITSLMVFLVVLTMAIWILVLPYVIPLAIFVFIFWPIIRNSWSSQYTSKTPEESQKILSKIRRLQREMFPLDIATFVWIGMVIIPSFIGIMIHSSSNYYNMVISLGGGLPLVVYDYLWQLPINRSTPLIVSNFGFITTASIFMGGLLIWIPNLLLGSIITRF